MDARQEPELGDYCNRCGLEHGLGTKLKEATHGKQKFENEPIRRWLYETIRNVNHNGTLYDVFHPQSRIERLGRCGYQGYPLLVEGSRPRALGLGVKVFRALVKSRDRSDAVHKRDIDALKNYLSRFS